MNRKSLYALGAAALLAAAMTAQANTKNKGADSITCGDNGTIAWSPTFIWPPNHKDVPATFTYTDSDTDGDMVSLTITAKPHDEMVSETEEMNGTGHTPAATDQLGGTNADTDKSVDVVGSVRAERSGRGDGRTYRFEYVATGDDSDDGCESDPDDDSDDLIIEIPHDCRDWACK